MPITATSVTNNAPMIIDSTVTRLETPLDVSEIARCDNNVNSVYGYNIT